MPHTRLIASIAGSLLLAGCSIPHNDVLIFGTQTMFALDASSAPEQGGVPQFTIGYKRKEVVWMPMMMNGICSRAATAHLPDACLPANSADGGAPTATSTPGVPVGNPPAPTQPTNPQYQGMGEAGRGWHGGGVDTYSVFASFGAKGSGSGNATGVEGQAELAQFFATGIAAQRLAANQRAPELVSLQSPNAEAVNKAIEAAVEAEIGKRESDIDRIISAVKTDGSFDATKWNSLVDKAKGGLAESNYRFLKQVTSENQAREELENKREKIDPLLNVLNAES
jgi:hypothetical protein